MSVDGLFWFWIVLAAVFMIFLIVFSHYAERKRREALMAEAAALGFRFVPGINYGLGKDFTFLNDLYGGSNNYVENMVLGIAEGHEIKAFDHHYETYSTDKNGRKTHHHWHHVYCLTLPASFPELRIGPENFLTRFAKNFGYPSIDFESHEFSKAFLVQSPDKKFAYDICHTRFMEYLLENRDIHLEIEGACYALVFDGKRESGHLHREVDRLLALRSHIPEYLLATSQNG